MEGRIVRLNVTHNLLTTCFREIRFDTACTIGTVKNKIYTITGTEPGFCVLDLRDSRGNIIASNLGPETTPLLHWNPQDFQYLHVTDTNPDSLARNGGLQDLSLVEKYVMPDDVYDKRDDTYRAWKRNMMATNPEFRAQQEQRLAAHQRKLDSGREECQAVPIGARVKLTPGDYRGTVRWIGQLDPKIHGHGRIGWHIGVELDDPAGNHDGEINGVRLFSCKKKGSYGALARPNQVTVGDFPPLTYFDDREVEDVDDADIEECSEL